MAQPATPEPAPPSPGPSSPPQKTGRFRLPFFRDFALFGPGIVYAVASIGPNDLVSNSAAGATYGYLLLWTLIVAYLAKYVFAEAGARYVIVTGESLLHGYRRCGRWVVLLLGVAIFLRRHINNLYMIALLGIAANMLVPIGTVGEKVWSIFFVGIGFSLMYWGGYKGVENWSRPLLFVLGGSLICITVLARPNVGEISRGLFIPSLPAEQGYYDYFLLLMSLLGSATNALSSLRYPSYLYEAGWHKIDMLRKQHDDLRFSIAAMFSMALVIQISAAAVLQPMGIDFDSPDELALLFQQGLGEAGRILLAIGLLSAVFTSFIGANNGYSLIVTEIFRSLRTPADKPPPPPDVNATRKHPVYRICIIWFVLTPMYVLWTDFQPFFLVIFSSALFVMLLPLTGGLLLVLTNNRKLLGEHVNGWFTNIAISLLVLLSLFLTYQNGVRLVGRIFGS
jgi:Mn2+/Fe2+ NRAMP family transporter